MEWLVFGLLLTLGVVAGMVIGVVAAEFIDRGDH